MVSIFLRSLVYNVLFYALLVFWILIAIPTYLMPPRAFMGRAEAWARSSIWLMRVICNTKVEYRGLEKIPRGPLIVASKHQSMWETFALMQFFDAPLFIYKRELGWIPFFGWYLMKAKMIGVDRSGGMRSLMEMARGALHSGGAEFRTVLAAPDLHALSGHAVGRIPRSAAARPHAQGFHRADQGLDRGRHQPAGRGGAPRAGAIVRPGAGFDVGEGL